MVVYKNKTKWWVKLRARYRRMRRLIYMSPAEAQFIRVMGGVVLTLPFIESRKTGFPFTLVLSMGKILRSQNIRREVRVAGYFVDFGNDIKRGIEIDGDAFHRDILREQRRNDDLAECGWLVLHIKARAIYQNPQRVREHASSWLENGTLPTSPRPQIYPIKVL